MKIIYLYTTQGCHLCEQALQLVEPLLVGYGLIVEPVEIAHSNELMQRYGVRIPVLRVEDEIRELGWPFTREQFISFVETGEIRQPK